VAAIGSTNQRAGAAAPSARQLQSAADGNAVIQLLGVNDFHGHLEPPDEEMGGAAWLAAHLDLAEARYPGRTIRVHAGDMVGASPLVSSWFHDEPSIEATNLMRFDVGTLGNHEFDEGGDEMLRLIRGGHRDDGRQFKRDAAGDAVDTSDAGWAGADYPYIAANTFDSDGKLVLPPFVIVERAGVKIGFIGVTTTHTPDFLLGHHRSRYHWSNVSDSVNRWVPELQRRGVEAIVVLAHSGAVDGRGEIIEETREMDDAVDVVVAGHTHSQLDEQVEGKLVVQALSYGTAYDRIEMEIDRSTGEVVAKSADIPRTRHDDVEPVGQVAQLVSQRAERVGPLARKIVGTAAAPLAGRVLQERVAEAQRRLAKADAAVVHPSTVRAGLDAGPITFEELFAIAAYEHEVLAVEPEHPEDVLAEAREHGFVVVGRPGPRIAMSELVRDLLRARGGGSHAGTEVDALTEYAAAGGFR
jgi:5'-nucleotidase